MNEVVERTALPRWQRIARRLLRTYVLPFALSVLWAIGEQSQDSNKGFVPWVKAFGTSFFFLNFLWSLVHRAGQSEDGASRHAQLIAQFNEVKRLLPNSPKQVEQPPPAPTVAPASDDPIVVAQAESARAFEEGDAAVGLVNMARAFEMAVTNAVVSLVPEPYETYWEHQALNTKVQALGPFFDADERQAMSILASLRNRLLHASDLVGKNRLLSDDEALDASISYRRALEVLSRAVNAKRR